MSRLQSLVAEINGQLITLNWSEERQQYEAQTNAVSASSYNNNPGHYFPVKLTAVDRAGNSTVIDDTDSAFGNDLKLYVKEKEVPVITIITPGVGDFLTSSTPVIKFKITDNTKQTTGYAGIDKDTVVITLTDGSGKTHNIDMSTVNWETEGEFNAVYTGTFTAPSLADGTCTINIIGADFDGNQGEASSSFVVDTVAPELTIESPVEGYETNKSKVVVKGKTNDITSNPVDVIILLNGEDTGDVVVEDTGDFSKEITFVVEGNQVITIKAIDAAGKETVAVRNIVFSTEAPIFTFVKIQPNPVDAGTTYEIIVKVE